MASPHSTSLENLVVPYNETFSDLRLQQERIWKKIPGEVKIACKVLVKCEKSQASGHFHSRATDTKWTAPEKKDNYALMRRLHRALFGRSDRPSKTLLSGPGKQSGTKRKSDGLVQEESAAAVSDPEGEVLESKRARKSPEPSKSIAADVIQPESEEESEQSDSAMSMATINEAEPQESSDTLPVVANGKPSLTKTTRIAQCGCPEPSTLTFTEALTKSRMWRKNPQADAKATIEERIAVYQVLVREYFEVLPMTDEDHRLWAIMESYSESSLIPDIFDIDVPTLAEVFMPWKLSFERQTEVFQELIRAGLVVQTTSTYGPCKKLELKWEWYEYDSDTEIRNESIYEIVLGIQAPFSQHCGECHWSMTCTLCSVFNRDDDDELVYDCDHDPTAYNFRWNDHTPDQRRRRRKLKPILVQFLRSPSLIVLWAVGMGVFSEKEFERCQEQSLLNACNWHDSEALSNVLLNAPNWNGYRPFARSLAPAIPVYLRKWHTYHGDWIRWIVYEKTISQEECMILLEQCATEAQADKVLRRAETLENKWKRQVEKIMNTM